MPRNIRGKANRLFVNAARRQRRAPTPAEEKLWQVLRNGNFAGLKFRRQHPFERFILDLFCVEHQLAIEVDGSIHAGSAQAMHDRERTEFLKARGIRVLRFSNTDVEHDLIEVLRQIVVATSNPETL